MAAKLDLPSIWRNVKELDLQRIRQSAERELRLVIAGGDAGARQMLAQQLCSDPRRPDSSTQTPIPLVGLELAGQIAHEDLILFLFSDRTDQAAAQSEVLSAWAGAGKRVILLLDPDEGGSETSPLPTVAPGHELVRVSVYNWSELQLRLAPRIIHALPDDALALGRSFPLLRETIARSLISETANANAAYSFSTGLAEIIPVLGVPLNIADMIVLTKAQGMLVYKLGLALGMPSDWQFYITEFSGVIGSGFLWRQVARSLVGLIPAWGIIPKVAVAYSGTYTVGMAVLHWYLTGRHATGKILKGFMREALGRGKSTARSLRARLPFGRKSKTPELPAAIVLETMEATVGDKICTRCSTINDDDARFCKSCGAAF